MIYFLHNHKIFYTDYLFLQNHSTICTHWSFISCKITKYCTHWSVTPYMTTTHYAHMDHLLPMLPQHILYTLIAYSLHKLHHVFHTIIMIIWCYGAQALSDALPRETEYKWGKPKYNEVDLVTFSHHFLHYSSFIPGIITSNMHINHLLLA